MKVGKERVGWGGSEHFIAGRTGSGVGDVWRYLTECVGPSSTWAGVDGDEASGEGERDSDRERFGMVKWQR